MPKKIWIATIFIVLIAIVAGLIVWPSGPDIKIGSYVKSLYIHRGLDLQGGSHIVYVADMSKVAKSDQNSAMNSLVDVIKKRVDGLGVSEPIVQSTKIGNSDGLIVELPGVTDVNHATQIIGQTAQLVFKEMDANQQWQSTGLTGADLKKADNTINSQTSQIVVTLDFNANGTKLFDEITKRNLSKPVAIFLDNQLISAPTVQSEITDGKAEISGQFDIKAAKDLAVQLNAGALPVPISIIEQQNVGATLGSESIQKSVVAGLIGIILVAIFMISYYRLPGVIATIALFIYTLIVVSFYKLIPITLTLGGIAGFILSIGMAVDANILIFERFKEELRQGTSLGTALDEGFRRAWNSIRDSNISSLITALILFLFTSGTVKGFATTLIIGILVSMFTAIIVTRNLLKLVYYTPLSKYLSSFAGLPKKEEE